MLEELSVEDFALFERVSIPFGPGLNALTGETGAGKSILVEALACACGARGREEWVRAGAQRARVTARFRFAPDGPIAARLAASGVPCEDGELLFRREIARDGRGRAWVNGSPAAVAEARALAADLVDLHGQHESQSLLSPERHLALLDASAGLDAGRDEVAAAYDARAAAHERLAVERARLEEARAHQGLLERELREIDAVDPKAGEEERLEGERRALSHRTRLLAILERADEALAGGGREGAGAAARDDGAARRADRALRALREGAALDARLAQAAEHAESALVALDEAAALVTSLRARLEDLEGDVDALIGRIEEIARLRKRYGGSLDAVLARRASLARDLALVASGDDRLEDLRREAATADRALAERAAALSKRRSEAARGLAAAVTAELRALGMRAASFEVRVEQSPAPDGLAVGGRILWTGRTGVDNVGFHLAPNPGEGTHPLARIASGGELSRVLLALMSVLGAGKGAPVSVFDEVDAGVGADAAAAIGARLRSASRGRQLFVITHFAQIAALADRHVRVSKVVRGGRTNVAVETLEGPRRTEEIARMLGGEGDGALRHAEEILAALADRGARAAGPASPRKAAGARAGRK
jgi:DNA repair protein RecN (Recombination protein N)